MESFAYSNTDGIKVYHKNVHMMPEHKQQLADDINRYRTADNLWDALREEFSLQHYEDAPAVQEKIKWFMNNQDFLMRSATRAAPYLYYILQQVKKRHLPAELVLLPIVESGYNPFNRSPVGAVGIWQLMPNTASGLGVKQDWWYDGRRDIIASTSAALNYLAYLQTFFDGNWLLAMAAYNTGEGNVLSAIKRNIRDGRETSFWSLPIAQQTRDYVPSILALAVIINHPERYPIYLPPVRNAPYLAQIDIGTQIDLKLAAELAGITHKDMLALNSAYKQKATATNGPYKLILPIENVAQFTENLANTSLSSRQFAVNDKINADDTFTTFVNQFRKTPAKKNTLDESVMIESKNASPNIMNMASSFQAATSNYALKPGDTIYMVRSKDTIETIAKRFNISVNRLKMANHMGTNKLAVGGRLVIPTHISTIEVAAVATPKNDVFPGDTVYMVRRGDTVETISKKFHTTPAAIRIANLMGSNNLQEGDRLVVPTHMRS